MNEKDLRAALEAIDPSLKSVKFELKLYPSIGDKQQTVLLNLNSSTAYFQSLKDYEPNYAYIRLGGKTDTKITIDSTFYDLTPLNAPTGNVVAEFVP